MKDVASTLLIALIAFAMVAIFLWERHDGLKTGRIIYGQPLPEVSRDKQPVLFRIFVWLNVLTAILFAGLGIFVLALPFLRR